MRKCDKTKNDSFLHSDEIILQFDGKEQSGFDELRMGEQDSRGCLGEMEHRGYWW